MFRRLSREACPRAGGERESRKYDTLWIPARRFVQPVPVETGGRNDVFNCRVNRIAIYNGGPNRNSQFIIY